MAWNKPTIKIITAFSKKTSKIAWAKNSNFS